MLKLLIFISFLLGGCSAGDDQVFLSKDRCWGDIEAGKIVKGNAQLNFFPDDSAFLSNSRCPEKSIPVSLQMHAKNLVDAYYKKNFGLNERVVGMEVDVRIEGDAFSNRGSDKVLIDVAKIEVMREGKVTPIIMK